MNAHSVTASAVRRDREKQERRTAIVAAAERVIIARGFAEASMDGIAREAGLAAGTVYLYFPNKEALFQELLGSRIRGLNEAVSVETGVPRPFAQALPAVVQAMFRHFEEHRAFFEVFSRERIEFTRGAAQSDLRFREIEAGAEHMAKWIGTAQRRGEVGKGRPKLMATALRGLVFQFTRDWLRGGAEGRLTQHAAFVSNFFLKGAAA
jgi:AcrR family transcriptional regulator